MILVTGGNGFVGKEVVDQLVGQGNQVRLLCRKPLKKPVAGTEVVLGDIDDPASLDRAMTGVHTVVHLVGIIAETGIATFEKVHVEGTRNVVNAAKKAGAYRLLHMSALGSRKDAPSKYHQTKFAAEEIVQQSGLSWTIFRPSIIFGKKDAFVNMLASMMKLPFRQVPMIGDGDTILQPIAVENVAFVFAHALTHSNTVGQIYELCGEDISYRNLLVEIARVIGLNPVVVPQKAPWIFITMPLALLKGAKPAIFRMPIPMARVVASIFQKICSPVGVTPPLTNDQIDMLQEDQHGDKEKVYQEFQFEPVPFRHGIEKYLNP